MELSTHHCYSLSVAFILCPFTFPSLSCCWFRCSRFLAENATVPFYWPPSISSSAWRFAEPSWRQSSVGASQGVADIPAHWLDRKSTRLNSSHLVISYAV